jgi:uncharacterized protein YraI
MPLVDMRAGARRALAVTVALLFCFGSLLSARAQESAATIGSAGEPVLLRESPGYDAMVLATLGEGSAVQATGEAVAAADGSLWLPVVGDGLSGYVPAGYVAAPSADAPSPSEPAPVAAPAEAPSEATDPASATLAAGATTTTDANLRAAPSADAEIVQVLPPGTSLAVDGAAENGFVPVSGAEGTGWVAAELLAQRAENAPVKATESGAAEPAPLVAPEGDTATTAAEPAREKDKGKSTGIIWPFSGGEWEVVQGYNNGTHENRSNFAQYKYAIDWARVDGDTAGQTVFAPVSGTIQWVDRGSGGLLIDAGAGYGVALFHVTLDRGISGGDNVNQGERIGRISGPGDDGYMSMAHIEIDCWRLSNGGDHESVPFEGQNAIAGQEFPDTGGTNQYMGATVSP